MLKQVLGIIGWLGTALVLAAVVVRFTLPAWENTWRGLVYAGLVCALLYMLSQWREVAGMFAGRSARYGTLASASILIVIGLLAGINYIGARQHKRWDLTASKQYTLSEQTQKVLRSLQKPVTVRVFERDTDFDRFRSRLGEYENVTDKITTEYIDPEKKPALGTQYKIQNFGTVILEYDGRTERVLGDSEQELTNGFIKLLEGRQKKVYFVQGHGEKDTGSAERGGYAAVSAGLANQNFAVEKLVLAQTTAVPDDASVVVFAGPKTDVLQPEADALRAYLKKGGKLFVLVDPPQLDAQPLTNLVTLLKEWAIEVGNDVVWDPSAMRLPGTDETVALAANYPSHPIVQDFRVLTAYPLSRSVAPTSGGTNGRFAQTFIETHPSSWAETDVKALLSGGKAAKDAAADKAGPVSIAAAASAPAEDAPKPAEGADTKVEKPDAPKLEARVAVIGDSDFAANGFLGFQGNRDIFFGTLNWLAQQENLIAIAPKDPEDRRLALNGDQQLRLFYLSVLLLPGLIIGTGVYTWWKRR